MRWFDSIPWDHPFLMTNQLSPQERLGLVQRNTVEVLTPEELLALFATGEPVKHYQGFEISGQIHLGTGIVSMSKVKDLQDAGVECTLFLADWHTWINEKLGGADLATIREIALEYFAEGMKVSLKCVGGDPDKLKVVLGSDLYHQHDDYWATVIEVSKHTTLARMQRSITILGRKEGESVDFAKLIYPAMQAADIFFMDINIAHAGMDQRKAHVIARDVANHMKISPIKNKAGEPIKPCALHQPLLMGLVKPPVWPVPDEQMDEVLMSMKMSKSNPNSAVFVHDSPDAIRDKIAKAFCPPSSAHFNPILNWAQRIIFEIAGGPFVVNKKHGGDVTFKKYEDLESEYVSGGLHPMDLKAAVSDWLIQYLEPAREKFSNGEPQAALDRIRTLTS